MKLTLVLIAGMMVLDAAASAAERTVGSVDVYSDGGRIHLLVGRRGEEKTPPSLEYRRSDDGGTTWSEPVPVGAGFPVPYRVEPGDIQLAAHGERVFAVWSAKGPGPMGSGRLVAALSKDGGRTWKKTKAPSDDGSEHGRRFVDLATDASGRFHAVWLDRRASAELRYASSRDGSKWSKENVLDKDTCECCWNTITAAKGGEVYALYRDKDPRDMALFSSLDAGKTWSSRTALGDFNWGVNVCPHAGGGLTVNNGGKKPVVEALVWTGQEGKVGLYHVASEDGGRSWGKPMRLGSEDAKHADIASGAGRSVAVWDESIGGKSAVFVAVSSDQGRTWQKSRQVSPDAASAAYPRVVGAGSGFRVFWLEKRGDAATWASNSL